jgi:DNA polymerase-3 subunit epsilon
MSLLGRLLGKEHQRKRAFAKAAPGPLADYLAEPFPDKDSDCREIEIVAIDLETTGLDPQKDDILSIGMINIDHFGVKLSSAWHSIVRIERDVPGESAVIHHITDDQSAAGYPIETLLPEMLRRLAGRPMLVHYSPIEQNFISAVCQRLYGAPFVAPIIDTLEIAQRVFERRNHLIQPGDLRLFNLRPRYNLPQYKAHNALYDALATAELFLAMADNLYPERPCPLGEFLSKR